MEDSLMDILLGLFPLFLRLKIGSSNLLRDASQGMFFSSLGSLSTFTQFPERPFRAQGHLYAKVHFHIINARSCEMGVTPQHGGELSSKSFVWECWNQESLTVIAHREDASGLPGLWPEQKIQEWLTHLFIYQRYVECPLCPTCWGYSTSKRDKDTALIRVTVSLRQMINTDGDKQNNSRKWQLLWST